MNPIVPKVIRLLKEYYVYENYIKCFHKYTEKTITFKYICNLNDYIIQYKFFNFNCQRDWFEIDNNLRFWNDVDRYFKRCYWNNSFHLDEFEEALEDLVIIYNMI